MSNAVGSGMQVKQAYVLKHTQWVIKYNLLFQIKMAAGFLNDLENWIDVQQFFYGLK